MYISQCSGEEQKQLNEHILPGGVIKLTYMIWAPQEYQSSY